MWAESMLEFGIKHGHWRRERHVFFFFWLDGFVYCCNNNGYNVIFWFCRAQTSELWVKGEKVTCGYISEDTRVRDILRAVSATTHALTARLYYLPALWHRWCSDPHLRWFTSLSRWVVRCGTSTSTVSWTSQMCYLHFTSWLYLFVDV